MREKYQSLFMESYIKDLQKAIKSISNILKQYKINFTIIGGAARNQYGYRKMTEDIDILLAKEDKDKIKNIPIGFLKDESNGRAKVFQLHDPKTRIEIIYDNEISGDGIHGLKFDNPKNISHNINGDPYITLKNLIMYKLSSGIYGKHRFKDFDDIVELIKINHLKRNYANDFREDLKNKYISLWEEIYE